MFASLPIGSGADSKLQNNLSWQLILIVTSQLDTHSEEGNSIKALLHNLPTFKIPLWNQDPASPLLLLISKVFYEVPQTDL